MLIAIPSVTSYINNSRKNSYVSSINEIINGNVAKVNNGDLEMYDEDTTYYIPTSAIKLESGNMKSPYADMDESYVAVTYDGESYDYYFVGKDRANMGIGELTRSDKIDKDKIGEVGAIDTTVGIEGKSKVVVFDSDLVAGPSQLASTHVSGGGSAGGSGGSGGASNAACVGNDCTCKRATQLHQPICEEDTNSGCNEAGEPGYGNQITYGKLGTNGTLAVGDAFDCDVNGDGTYNPTNERFYYVTTSGDQAVLLYYSNTLGGVPNTSADLSYYVPEKLGDDTDDCSLWDDEENDWLSYHRSHNFVNYMGPLGALGRTATNNPSYDVALPTTSQWSNVRLSNTSRAIKGPNGETSVAGHVLPTDFSYAGYAARLLTYQEVANACNPTTVGYNTYISSACSFMKENTYYDLVESTTTSTYTDYCLGGAYYYTGGFYLETPYIEGSGVDDKGYYYGAAYSVSGSGSIYGDVDGKGFRPAIEVPLNKVER